MDINSRPKAFMLIGIPGSGKSTLHATFDPDLNFHCFSTDNEIEAIAAREGKTYSEVFADAYPEALNIASAKLNKAIDERRSIVFDQTNLSSKKRSSTIAKLPAEYYKVGLVLLPPANHDELDDLMYRLDNRPGKTISWGIITNMMKTFDIPTTSDGFDQVSFFNPFLNEPNRIVNSEVFNIQTIQDTFRFMNEHIRKI